MSVPRTRKRWLEVLRRTTADPAPTAPRPALEDAAIWEAHARATKTAQEVDKLAERVVALATRQRGNVDAAAERASTILGRGEALSADLRAVLTALDRVGVVGLNAGLEGARSGEGQGRALSLVSDEIRTHVARGADAARELGGHLDELLGGLNELGQRVERAQREGLELTQDAAGLKTTARDGIDAIRDVEVLLRRATGLDPERAKLVSAASEHARGLLAALSSLEGSGAAEALRALAPLLSPVAKLLAGMAVADPDARTDQG